MIGFVIDAAGKAMSVGGVRLPIGVAGLATNISSIYWSTSANPTSGVVGGSIIYNDRPTIPEQFLDPSPYQTYLNEWMTAATALTLAQARAIKGAYAQTVYAYKRQLPVTVTLSTGSHTFPCDNNPLLLGAAVNGIGASVNAVPAAINSSIVSNLDSQFAALNAAKEAQDIVDGAAPTPIWFDIGTVSNTAAPVMPTISLLPVGSLTPVSLTSADALVLFTAITSYLQAEQLVNATKQAAINALTSVSSVISYDATAGW